MLSDDELFDNMVGDREALVAALIDDQEQSELLLNELVRRFEISNTQALAAHQLKYNFDVEVIAELLYPMNEFRGMDLVACGQQLRVLMERSSAFMDIVSRAKLSLEDKDDVARSKPKYFLDFIANL